MTVRKAIIPAAGRGTRMRPFSLLVPKELVPIGTRPALFWVVDEAARAGIEEIALVVRAGKQLLEEAVETLRGDHPGVRFVLVEQPEPVGLADAIARCRAFAAGEPFVLMMPDNVLLSPRHDLRRLLRLSTETRMDALGVISLTAEHSGLFGRSGLFDSRPAGSDRFRITALHDKGSGTLEIPAGQRVQRTCGRIVCRPHVFDYIERLRRETIGEELSEVPVYQAVIADHGAMGLLLSPPLFDVGHPPGYLMACAWLAQNETPDGTPSSD